MNFTPDQEALRVVVEKLETVHGACGVWLFGSRAEGRAQPHSDWDLLVVVDEEVSWESTLRLREQAGGLNLEVHSCTPADFEVDRFVVGTCAFAAWNRGRELQPRGRTWLTPSEEAQRAGRARWVQLYLQQAERALKAQVVLWAAGLHVDNRRELVDLGIQQETMPAWVVRWLARALLLERGVDHGAARTVTDLVGLLSPADKELLVPLLLDDDDDDAVGDPVVLAAASRDVAAAITSRRL